MRFNFSKIRKSFDLSYVFVSKRSIVGFLSYTPSKMILVMIFINRWERLSTLLSLVASLFFCFQTKIALLILYIITSATVTVTEKLDRELFTTSILFTFFQTVPGRLERDVTMAGHIGFSFANICSSAQAYVYDSLLLYGNTSTGNTAGSSD